MILISAILLYIKEKIKARKEKAMAVTSEYQLTSSRGTTWWTYDGETAAPTTTRSNSSPLIPPIDSMAELEAAIRVQMRGPTNSNTFTLKVKKKQSPIDKLGFEHETI